MDQIVQVLGSLLILTAFTAAQRGWLSTESRAYLVLNLVGAGVLAVLAALAHQFGFLLLEFCWAIVAGHALMSARR
jgi:membrane-bound ClpP family serine protease